MEILLKSVQKKFVSEKGRELVVLKKVGDTINNEEFVMNASVNLDQLRDLFSVEIQSDGFDTVGGLVYQRLGKIPSSGDSVEHVGIRIEVLSTSGRRLKNLKVNKLPEFKS